MSKGVTFMQKFVCAVISAALIIGMLAGCGIGSGKKEKAVKYDVVLENMTDGDNKHALDYVNSLGFVSSEFRQAFYNYLAEGAGSCFINMPQEDVVALELSNVSDLTDLRLFPNLIKIKITDSDIEDFSPVTNLKHLEILTFCDMNPDCTTLANLHTKKLEFLHCTPAHTEALASVKGILSLEVNYSHIGNIDFISGWDSLNEVTLCNADVQKFDSLKNRQLNYLRIAHTHVEDWSFLSTVSAKILDISFTNFKDFSLINGEKTKSLNLNYTFADNLNGISKFKNLEELYVDSCYKLQSIDEIQQIKKLKTVSIENLEMVADASVVLGLIAATEECQSCDYRLKNEVIDFYDKIGIKSEMSDAEKTRLITIAVLDQITFGKADTAEDTYYCNTHELESALDGVGNCASYSGFTSALLTLAGVENCNISGENFEDDENYLHRWNVVKIDGQWKGLDVTFLDDENINGAEALKNGETPSYFLAELDDPTWMEYHFPYYMPEYDASINFAK